jgi:hypothetical protein
MVSALTTKLMSMLFSSTASNSTSCWITYPLFHERVINVPSSWDLLKVISPVVGLYFPFSKLSRMSDFSVASTVTLMSALEGSEATLPETSVDLETL